MFCTNCGCRLEEGAKFCSSCGARVGGTETEGNTSDFTEKNTESYTENAGSTCNTDNSDNTGSTDDTGNYSASSSSTGKFKKFVDTSDRPKMVIQIISLVFAVIYLWYFVDDLICGIGNFFNCLTQFNLFGAIGGLLRIGIGAAALGTAAVLLHMDQNWTEEDFDDYFVTAAELGIFAVIVALVRELALVIGYRIRYSIDVSFNFSGSLSRMLILCIIMCAAYFVAAAIFKIPFMKGINSENAKERLVEAPKLVYAEVVEFYKAWKKEHDEKKAASSGSQNMDQSATGNASFSAGSQGGSRYFVPLKTDRSLFIYILLSLVTFGIYPLYFIYKLAKDVNTVCDGDGRETPGLLALLLLTYITCGIYAYVWYYKLGNRLAVNAGRYGMNFQENGTTILLWMLPGALLCGIGPFISMYIIIKNTNALCAAYNNFNMK